MIYLKKRSYDIGYKEGHNIANQDTSYIVGYIKGLADRCPDIITAVIKKQEQIQLIVDFWDIKTDRTINNELSDIDNLNYKYDYNRNKSNHLGKVNGMVVDMSFD
jgi:hypothetical protein